MKRRHPLKKLRSYLTLKKINPVIRIITASDLITISSFGLLSPIFAVFIVDSIEGGSVAVVGFASAAYLISKSIFQIPVAIVADRIKGEKDDFWFLLIGSIIFSVVPLGYIFISLPWQLYLVQFIYGAAAAATIPTGEAIFSRHLDKDKEAIEHGIYGTLIDLAGAVMASLGGFFAFYFGFDFIFILISITSFFGSLLLIAVYRNLQK